MYSSSGNSTGSTVCPCARLFDPGFAGRLDAGVETGVFHGLPEIGQARGPPEGQLFGIGGHGFAAGGAVVIIRAGHDLQEQGGIADVV